MSALKIKKKSNVSEKESLANSSVIRPALSSVLNETRNHSNQRMSHRNIGSSMNFNTVNMLHYNPQRPYLQAREMVALGQVDRMNLKYSQVSLKKSSS